MAFTLTASLKVIPPSNISSIVQGINRQLKGINANINLGLPANAQRQLAGINSQMKSLGSNAKSAQNFMESFGKSAANSIRRFAGFTIFASTFYTLTKAIKSSLDEAIAFQRELVKIRQVSGLSLKDLKGLTDEVTRLSTSFGVSSKKLLSSAQILAQAGFSVDRIKKSMETLALIELAPTFDDVTDATEGMVAVMGQFSGVSDDFKKEFGSINAVAAKFAVESSDIITAIRRTGGAFSAAGGDLKDLIALFTSVRQTTRESAESIATGFRTIFTRIQRTRTIDFLERLGINLRDDVTKQFVKPYEAIRRLSAALTAIPSTDVRFAQITEELGGFRQISKVIPLIQKFNIAEQARIVAQRGENSLTNDAAKAQDAFSIKLKKVHEEFQALIRTVSENQVFKQFLDEGIRLSTVLIKLAGSLETILPLLAILGSVKIGKLALAGAPSFFGGVGLGGAGAKATAGIGLGALVLPSLVSSFAKLDDKAKAVVGDIQTFGGTLLSLSFAMRSFGEIITHNQENLGLLRPKSQQLTSETKIGGAIGRNLYKQFAAKAAGNKLLDVEINSRKSRLIANQTALNYGSLSPSARKKASAEVVQDTIHLKSLGRDKKRGQLEEDSLRRETTAQKTVNRIRLKELDATNKQIKALEVSETKLQAFNIGVAAVSGLLLAFGQNLQREAGASLAAGNSSAKGSFAGGKGLSGVGFGAASLAPVGLGIGSLFGGPAIGGLIGAGIGAAIGGLKGTFDGLKEAAEILERGNFTRSMVDFTRVLDNVQSGKSAALGNITKFQGGVNLLENRLATSSLGDKESSQGAIDNAIVGIQQFLNEVAKTTTSFEQLEAIVGTDVLEKFGLFTKLPFAQVKEQFENQIKTQNNLVKNTNILTEAQANQLSRLQLFNNLSAALQDSIDGLRSFSDILDTTKIKDLSSVFDRSDSIIDKGLLKRAVGQTTSVLGPEASVIGKDFIKSTEILNKLPDIIIDAAAKPFSDSKEFIDDFEDSLKRAFPDISDVLANSLKANVLKFRGAEGKDQKIFAEIQENPTNFLKQVGEGILEAQRDFLAANHKIITQQLNDLASIYEKRRQVEEKLIQGLNSTINLREQKATFGFESRGLPFPFADAEGFEKDKLNAARGGSPFSTVEGFSLAAKASQQQILFLNELLQDETGDRTKLLVEIEEEKDARADAIRGLEFFGDATARNAASLKELELVQKRQKAKFDFAKSFTFGDLDARRELGRGALAGGLLARGGDISKIPGTVRGGALSFLEGFDDTKLGFLGGKSGREVIKDTIEKTLTGAGLAPGEAKEIALNKTTPAEEKLINSVTSNFNKSIFAQDVLNTLTDYSNVLLGDIVENTKGFKDLLEKHFIGTEISKLEGRKAAVGGELVEANRHAGVFSAIRDIIGSDPNKFGNVRNALPQLTGLEKQKGLLGERKNRFDAIESLGNFDHSIVGLHDLFDKLGGAPFNQRENIFNKLGEGRFNNIRSKFRNKFGGDTSEEVFNSDFYNQFDSDNGTIKQFLNIFQNRIKSLGQGINKDTQSLNDDKQKLLTQTGAANLSELGELGQNANKLTDLFKAIPPNATFEGLINASSEADALTVSLTDLNTNIEDLKLNQSRIGRAGGGFIPGSGRGDTVPAMLTPGEFVIRKDAAEAIGYDQLHAMNSMGFARGGRAERRAAYFAGKDARKTAYMNSKNSRFSIMPAATKARLAPIGGANLSGDKAREYREERLSRALRRNESNVGLRNDLHGIELDTNRNKIEDRGDNLSRILTQNNINIRNRDSIKSKTGVIPHSRFGSLPHLANGGIVCDRPIVDSPEPSDLALRLNPNLRARPATSQIKAGTHGIFGKHVPRFASGGTVEGGYSGGISPQAVESLSRFGENINRLSTSLDNFPRSVEMSVRHTIEVIHNGAAVFASLNEQFASLAEATVSREINKLLKNKFPELGKHE